MWSLILSRLIISTINVWLKLHAIPNTEKNHFAIIKQKVYIKSKISVLKQSKQTKL